MSTQVGLERFTVKSKHDIQETSLEAYRAIVDDLGHREQQVLNVFLYNPRCNYTDAELGYILGLPVNCITGRRGSLVNKGFLFHCCTRLSVFGVQSGIKHKAYKLSGLSTEPVKERKPEIIGPL